MGKFLFPTSPQGIGVRSTLAAAAFVIILVYLASLRRRKNLKYPPGPAPLPIIGNLLFLAKHQANNVTAFRELASRYGDIFCIHLGKYPMVVVNSYKLIKEAFVTNNDATDHRPVDLSAIKKCVGGSGM